MPPVSSVKLKTHDVLVWLHQEIGRYPQGSGRQDALRTAYFLLHAVLRPEGDLKLDLDIRAAQRSWGKALSKYSDYAVHPPVLHENT